MMVAAAAAAAAAAVVVAVARVGVFLCGDTIKVRHWRFPICLQNSVYYRSIKQLGSGHLCCFAVQKSGSRQLSPVFVRFLM